jgi:hypothetical protein
MGRDHFAQMYKNKSHRHDEDHDSIGFDKAMGAITGMLYSIVTLKAFFPSAPAPEMNKYPVKDAAGGDSKYTQLPLF